MRIAAARGLSSLPQDQLAAQRAAFDAALAENIAAQNVSLDMPGAQFNLAVVYFYAQGRQYTQALPWAEKLLALDPANAQAQQLVGELRARQRD
jgi:hypothetical protein